MTAPLAALATRISGRVVTTSEPDWDSVRTGFNLTTDVRPHAVVLPAHAADVVQVVEHARAHGLRIAAQATGHNNGAHRDLTDALLVDVRDLREITIDADARRVRVGAGVRWQDVVPALSDLGLAALHGSSPLVGIAGYSLGGGMGWLARKYGLQTNSVTALEVVTADARLRRVDPQNEPDLFWALRGGNGNFGVVTGIEFEVYAVSDLYAGALFFPADSAQLVLRRWFGLAPRLPEEMMTWTSLIHFPDDPEVPGELRGRPFTVFHCAYLGDAQTGADLLRPIRDLGPVLDTFATVPPAVLADMAMDPPAPLPYLSTTALVDRITPQALDDLLDAVGPDSGSPLSLVQIRQLGGALGRQAPGAGARATIPGSYSVLALGVVAEAGDEGPVASYLARLDDALRPYRVGEYPNFVEQPGDASRFFTPQTWERLRAVKTAYDPGDLFQGNHHVPPLPHEQAVNE
ncbi:FAD-binding oxidoreductase [Nocardioides antri]|nr:FAD-binding oxidoreductase [Nocardioides antri]